MDQRILVTGSEGLVGSRFLEISHFKNDLHTPRMVELNIMDPAELKAVISSYDFSAIVNFAAYTDVNAAELERGNKDGDSWQINVEGVKNIAEAIKNSGKKIHFIHLSTDMVFPGDKKDKGPYKEDHPVKAELDHLTWFGYTKAQGEKVLREVLRDNFSILRLIYPVRASFTEKLDYLRKPLKLFDEGKLYPLFKDQKISVTFVDEACFAIDEILLENKFGIFHASSFDTTSPHELISYTLEKTRGKNVEIESMKVDEFIKKTDSPTYRYPKFGGLKVEETEKELRIEFSSWKEVVDKLIKQGLGSK
jgi:dTDP-4-dehydrorhamnose reductase